MSGRVGPGGGAAGAGAAPAAGGDAGLSGGAARAVGYAESGAGGGDVAGGGCGEGLAGVAADAAGEMVRALEAMLFAADAPMSAEALARHLAAAGFAGAAPGAVRHALVALAAAMAGRGVVLVERGGRWHLETAPDLAHILRPLHEAPRRLSRAATECLAVIAYHEPVSRAEIEAIRGVQTAKGTLDVLIEAGWVRIAGRREVPGRPVIYATTPGFLAHFGLSSRRDLPGIEDLRAAGLLDPMPGDAGDGAERDDATADAGDAGGHHGRG